MYRYLAITLLLLVSACNSPPPGPQPKATTPTTAATQAVDNAPSDVEDWTDSSWKLFKSSLRSTFTTEAHKVRSPKGDLNFTHYQPISLDVSNMDIVEDYKSPMHTPNVEHLMPISPAEAMRIWVKDRLRAVGFDKTLQVVIKDASVISTPLPLADGSESRNRKYDARLEVELRIYGSGRAMSEASITVAVTQSNNISESASLAERKAIYRQMIFDLMDSANAELEKQIFKYFTRYINYAQTP